MDERTLVAMFQEGQSTEAYEHIYDTYVDMVFSRCLYILVDTDMATDATQDSMVKIYFALSKFEGRSSLKTWIYRIATNHCFGVLKKRREVSLEELEDSGVEFKDDADLYTTLENASQVTNVLAQLPKDMRAVILLKYADGHSYEEVAAICQMSPSAVKMRIHRAKQELLALREQGRI